MIRPIMPADVFMVADLAERMHAESQHSHIAFNKKKLVNSLLLLLASASLVGFVDEKDKRIVGVVAGALDNYFFGEGFLLYNKGFYVLPEFRKSKSGAKLLRAYASAAKKLGIKQIYIDTSISKHAERLDFLYKQVGFEKIGSIYKMDF